MRIRSWENSTAFCGVGVATSLVLSTSIFTGFERFPFEEDVFSSSESDSLKTLDLPIDYWMDENEGVRRKRKVGRVICL